MDRPKVQRQASFRRNRKRLREFGELYVRTGLMRHVPPYVIDEQGASSSRHVDGVGHPRDVALGTDEGSTSALGAGSVIDTDTSTFEGVYFDEESDDSDDLEYSDYDDDNDDEDIVHDEGDASQQDPVEDVEMPFLISPDLGLNMPLLGNGRATGKDHLLVIMSLAIRHRLSYDAMMDMFSWTARSHSTNYLPLTKNRLWKILSRNPRSVRRHYYCSKCHENLGEVLRQPCGCGACGPNNPETHLGYFLQLSLSSQLKQILSLENVRSHLRHRFTRTENRMDALEDIYDGRAYKNLASEGNFLHNPDNFSLTFNTDGCTVSNSSSTSAWPVYAQINELPPHMRKRYMLLAGIYVDGNHPILNNLLGPFVEEARQLYADGITWEVSPGVRTTSRFVVVIACVDSPARASLTRMVQFNGRYGCVHCYATGNSLGPGRFVYPVQQSSDPLRNHDEVVADMGEAFRTRSKVRGFKGISCLTGLPQFDVCHGVVVDSMHAIFLGVVKQHLRLLMESVIEPYYIGNPNIVRIIDERLLAIRPPSRRSRVPRSITSWRQWKASEYRNWLEYAPACLEHVIDAKYVKHLALLTEGVHIINGDSISSAELHRADAMITKYVELFQNIFGVSNMSFNVHILTHVTTCVRNWGPIWTHSAFVFESWNKKLIDKITAAHARTDQIATRFLIEKFLVSAVYDDQVSPEARAIIAKMIKLPRNGRNNANVIVVTGKCVKRIPTVSERSRLLDEGYEPEMLSCYRGFVVNGLRFSCVDEVRRKKCDSVVFVNNRYYGLIISVFKFIHIGNERTVLFVKILRRVSYAFDTRHIQQVEESEQIRCLSDVTSIRPAVRIVVEDKCYVYPLPNCFETD